MNIPVRLDHDTEATSSPAASTEPAATAAAAAHPDPITGEPGAHPVGVGVGALGAGAAGAAIGAIAGPIGALIGAAIGAVAGGLAGKEVATSTDGAEALEGESGETASHSSASHSAGVLDTAGASQLPPALPASTADVPDESVEDYRSSHEFSPAEAPTGFPAGAHTAGSHTGGTAAGTVGDQLFGLSDAPVASSAPVANLHEEYSGAHGQSFVRDTGSEEAIRVSAYYKYLDRQYGGQPGDELSDWVQAENEVLQS